MPGVSGVGGGDEEVGRGYAEGTDTSTGTASFSLLGAWMLLSKIHFGATVALEFMPFCVPYRLILISIVCPFGSILHDYVSYSSDLLNCISSISVFFILESFSIRIFLMNLYVSLSFLNDSI